MGRCWRHAARFNALEGRCKDRIRTVADLAAAYLKDYRVKHRAITFAEYAIGHVVRHLGTKMVIEISDETVKAYQVANQPSSRA